MTQVLGKKIVIKLKDILNDGAGGMGAVSSKGEKTIKIKHKTSGKTLVVVDTPASRKKYTKMGYILPLPKHLKKIIKDMEKKEKEFAKFGVKVKNVVVPGLEWMADLK